MRVLVLHTQVPFVHGGAEVLSEGLVRALQTRGHEAEVVAIPLQWNPPERLVDTAIAWRMLDLRVVNGQSVDLVVCTKFPTWAVRHPNKALWLVHQHRQAYDLYGTEHSEFSSGDADNGLREQIFSIDRVGIGECHRKFAISENVSRRLKDYLGIDARALYPPVEDRDLRPESYAPFILSVARLDALKRVDALIEAWPLVDDALTLKIASDGPDREALMRRVSALGIDQRVEFLGRVSDAELGRLFRTCRAVYYAPIDEDYGYVAVEGLTAAKPIITAHDSGGVLEFVEDGRTGTVTSLKPADLAAAINRYLAIDVARSQGNRGRAMTANIDWDTVVNSLIGVAVEEGD